MPTFKLTLAYDGTDFVGWQRQATGRSIQGLLEDALRDLDGHDVTVIGASRTDAGVHALGQAASCSLDRTIAADVLVRALNARLPPDVRALTATEMPPRFHARFDARSKTYRYRIWNADVISPFERRYAWHVAGPLDVEAMRTAAELLEGRQDFAAFQSAGTTIRSTERTVTRSRVRISTTDDTEDAVDKTGSIPAVLRVLPGGKWRDPLVIYEITGDGFLRHMVRTIVGTLAEIGRGRWPAEEMRELLASGDRMRAGPTAPAEGLFLVAVEYGAL